MSPKPDVGNQLVRVHQRAIRRGARYWIGAAERLQAGELSHDVWFGAWLQYVRGVREDVSDALALYGRLRGRRD